MSVKTHLMACATIMLMSAPSLIHAANGLTLTGYGAESAGLAGVDLAFARDTTALNTNPAGLTQLPGQSADFYLEPYYTLNNAHGDNLNDSRVVDNAFGAVFGGGYSRSFRNGELVAGLGLFAQGGVGFVYKDLNTSFGTRDEFSAVFGIFKLTPGIAWKLNDRLSLGAAFGIHYAQAKQRVFPRTSSFDPAAPEAAFFGTALDDGQAWGFNGKIGLMFAASDKLTLALAYTSKVPLKLEDGSLRVNFEATGMGQVEYRDVTLSGIALPQEVGIGARYKVNPRWTFGGEINWAGYKRALSELTLSARKPDSADVPQEILSVQALDAKNLVLIAVAVEHQYSDSSRLRAGYHHVTGETFPERNLSPVLPLISHNLLTAGMAKVLTPQWSLGVALEYQIPTGVTYTNSALPFLGENNRESNEVLLLSLMVSRRW